jgi:hypothetical protein
MTPGGNASAAERDWGGVHGIAAERARQAAAVLCASASVATFDLPERLVTLADRIDEAASDPAAAEEVRAAVLEALRSVEAR